MIEGQISKHEPGFARQIYADNDVGIGMMKTGKWNGPSILYHADGNVTRAVLEDNLFVENMPHLSYD